MKFTTLIAAAVFALTAVTAQAEDIDTINNDPSAAAMAFDFLLVRPLGLAATVVGSVLFVAQLPFAIVMQDSPAVPAQKLVVEPAKFTFRRPLGQMD